MGLLDGIYGYTVPVKHGGGNDHHRCVDDKGDIHSDHDVDAFHFQMPDFGFQS